MPTFVLILIALLFSANVAHARCSGGERCLDIPRDWVAPGEKEKAVLEEHGFSLEISGADDDFVIETPQGKRLTVYRATTQRAVIKLVLESRDAVVVALFLRNVDETWQTCILTSVGLSADIVCTPKRD